ncbi:hypothetical protein AK812_SmicGene16267 [Symbiodinium microadriaticum]|uniref:Uncharacterized protein n=1 Tax=Symbiodinium microadriaticum TaxID=2951 RepID=A0A1Q9E0R2_SYMMI|nr:hypothetical protein AK812_SmicGene16267 [Symbiodinium microadriaticum]
MRKLLNRLAEKGTCHIRQMPTNFLEGPGNRSMSFILRSFAAADAAAGQPRAGLQSFVLALSTRMGKLEEMVSGQGRQLLIQAEDQRNVQQRLLEVRREALEGLTQLAQEPPMQRADSEMQIGTAAGLVQWERGQRGSAVVRGMPLTQSSRKSTSQQLHPSKLKWPSGGFCTLNAAADLKRWEASEELQRALTPLKALLVSGDADEVVSPACTHELNEALHCANKRHLDLPGGTHDLFQYKDFLVDTVSQFIIECSPA